MISVRCNVALMLCAWLGVGCQTLTRRAISSVSQEQHTPQPGVSLETQVGQMLLVGFSGTAPNDAGVLEARRAAEAGELGGLILHAYNIVSSTQLKALVDHMRSWRLATPLLICINQEGGQAQRLKPEQGFHAYPSAYQASQLPRQTAQAVYAQMAQELAQLGINVNFAPVVDLHDPLSAAIGARERSFSASAAEVTELARVFVAAHQKAGVHTVLKHFVGHGGAVGDTHKGRADVTERWTSEALSPYAQLIAQGMAGAIMTAHVTNRALDASGEPMTFSRTVLEQRLRADLHFDGVIISDDLQMGALAQDDSLDGILEKSIMAGHDVLLLSHNQAADGISSSGFRAIPHLHARAVAAVQRAITRGAVSAEQIAEHHARILRLKAYLQL